MITRNLPSRRPGLRGGVWIFAATLAVGTVVLGQSVAASKPPELSPKLNPFVYFEDGTALFLAVDGRAAQYIEGGKIFPLGIGVADQGKGFLTFGKESFTLEAPDGTKYPAVSYDEYTRDYHRSRIDQFLADPFIQILAQRFISYDYRTWNPFPFAGSNVAIQDQIELGRRQWTHATLYFPIPDSGLRGETFKLLVKPKQLAEPVVVTFELR